MRLMVFSNLNVYLNDNFVWCQNEKLTLTVNIELTMGGARNFREYPVWNEAVDYATQVYKITSEMP